MIQAFFSALSGLRAFAFGTSVTANNIANSQSENFKASRARFQDSAQGGVKVSVTQDQTPGAPVIDFSTGNTVAGKESSNVDLSREMVDLIINKQNFNANIKTIKTADEIRKSIIDIIT